MTASMPNNCLLPLSCKVVQRGFFGKMREARLVKTLGYDATPHSTPRNRSRRRAAVQDRTMYIGADRVRIASYTICWLCRGWHPLTHTFVEEHLPSSFVQWWLPGNEPRSLTFCCHSVRCDDKATGGHVMQTPVGINNCACSIWVVNFGTKKSQKSF